MASYTIELAPSLCGYVDSSDNIPLGSVSRQNYADVSSNTISLIKFDTSALSDKKKKKINNSYINAPWIACRKPATYIGGSFSWLQSSFDSNVTYNLCPNSGVIFFKYIEKPSYYGTYVFPFKNYDSGNIGYGNQAAPRNLFNQLSIGFKISNEVNAEDIKSMDWFTAGNGSSTPFLDWRFVFVLEDWNPALTPRFPISSAYVNPFAANTFSIGFDAFESIDFPTAQTVTYEIKDVSTGAVVSHDASMSVNLRNRNYLDIPVSANTVISGKNYQWRAKIVTDDGTTNFSAWADFTTLDAIPGAPIIVFPQSKYLDGASAITLTWQHNVTTGSTQHAYDLQYKQTGDWISLASHAISSAQSYTLPANFFAAGQMYWRVRTYNIDDVAGTYGTSSANVVQAKPVTPIISNITSTPRSTVSWQSVGQQAYKLFVKDSSGAMVWESGETFGTARSLQFDTFLADGNYTVSLTIQNGQGVWSDYANVSVHIANSPPPGDDYLVATPVYGGVKLDITLPVPQGVDYVGETYVGESYAAHQPYNASGTRYILRDGEPIALITGTTYTDYSLSGEHTYVCRIATTSGNYYDTKPVTAAPIIKYACISKFSTPQNVLALKFNEGSKPKLNDQLSKSYSEHYYAGRALSVHDITEHYSSVWDFTYSFLSKADYDALRQLLLDGDTVMLRDRRGYKAVGTLGSLKPSIGSNSIVASFTITESDASEVISYV